MGHSISLTLTLSQPGEGISVRIYWLGITCRLQLNKGWRGELGVNNAFPLESNGIKLSNRVIASSEAIFVLLEIASSSDSSQ